MNLKINPICKYSRGGGDIWVSVLLMQGSGSFTTEPTRLKPSDILEVWVVFFLLFSLALTG